MDAGTIGQAGVEHGVFFGDLASHPLRDIVHRRAKGIFAFELPRSLFQASSALDVDRAEAVDHDFGDRVVLQKRGDRLQEVTDAGLEDRLPRERGLGDGHARSPLIDEK